MNLIQVRKRIILIMPFLWASLCIFLYACSSDNPSPSDKSNTKSGEGTKSTDNSTSSSSEKLYEHSESLDVKSLKTKAFGRAVHMLWAVDNSEGMDDEVNAIKLGIKTFVQKLKEHSEVQTTLISATEGERSFDASMLRQASIHPIPFRVVRSRILTIFTNYLGFNPTPTNRLVPSYHLNFDLLRGEHYSHIRPNVDPASSPLKLSNHPSHNFFRDPKALKIFIVLSHEGNHKSLSGSQFFLKLKSNYGELSSYKFYGFLNFKAQSNRLQNTDGNQGYFMLVANLGGHNWHTANISPVKWEQILDQARRQITTQATKDSEIPTKQKAAFTLSRTISEVLEIKVNNKLIKQDDFHSQEKTLHISTEVVKVGDVVAVKYKSTEES